MLADTSSPCSPSSHFLPLRDSGKQTTYILMELFNQKCKFCHLFTLKLFETLVEDQINIVLKDILNALFHKTKSNEYWVCQASKCFIKVAHIICMLYYNSSFVALCWKQNNCWRWKNNSLSPTLSLLLSPSCTVDLLVEPRPKAVTTQRTFKSIIGNINYRSWDAPVKRCLFPY